MDQIVTPGLAVLNELSYGRVQLTPTVVPKWYRMSKTSGSYDWRTYQGHLAYLTEALGLADPDFDFSSYDAVYVMTPAAVNQTVSPTFNAGPNSTFGVRVDGKYIGNAVTFGHDARDSRNLGATILAHETGHMFGLVDLYNYSPRTTGTSYPGDQFQNFGSWSLMSNIFSASGYLAWERRKLGYLDANQVDCLDGTGGEEVTIQPVETTGGIKAVALPLDASRAVVIEVRAKLGYDANMCSDGVLIYDVDASAPNGVNVGSIRPSRTTTSGSLYQKCGAWADATYDLRAGGVSRYTDSATGISVQLLAVESNGAYRIRVKR